MNIEHPKDIAYFTEYKAPLHELLHSSHFTNINSTITFFGPMLYFMARGFKSKNILEIGTSHGYTSHYLANAVKDNAVRGGYPDGMFYGLDVVKTGYVHEELDKQGLPNTLLEMDSIDITPDTFKDVQFDLIFQDGAHDTQHVVHEIKTLWSQLKGGGNGYWISHDCYGPAEEAFHKLMPHLKGTEWVRLDDEVYGMAIIRKMSGHSEKTRWVPYT